MESRSAKELQGLIDRWRNKQGLGPASLGVILPTLSSEQIEHAHHLTRRARTRRMVKRWLAVAAVVAGLLVTVLWAARPPAVQRLAADPNFRMKPIMTLPEAGGHTLQIYQVEITTGSVTVWWGIIGEGVDELEPNLRPTLTRRIPIMERFSPAENSTAAVSQGRLVGRSLFRTVPDGRNNLGFIVLEDSSPRIRFLASIPPPATLPDPEARLIEIDESIVGASGTYIIKEVITAPDYTIIRVVGNFGSNPHLSLETDVGILPFWGSTSAGEDRVTSFIFGPLAPNVRHFVLQQTKLWQQLDLPLFADGRTLGTSYAVHYWQEIDRRIEVQVDTGINLVLDRPASVRDASGWSYPVTIQSASFTVVGDVRRWRIVTGPLSPGLEVSVLSLGASVLTGPPEWSATVQLPVTSKP